MNADRWPTAHAGWQALRAFWQAKQDIKFDHHLTPPARVVADAFPGATIAPATDTNSGLVGAVEITHDDTAGANTRTDRFGIPYAEPWQRPDDGPAVDLEATKAAITDAIGGDPTVQADLVRWVNEGATAGRFWRITDYPTTRCRNIYRVAVRLAKWDATETDRLDIIETDGDTIGARLGALTNNQAVELVTILDAALANQKDVA